MTVGSQADDLKFKNDEPEITMINTFVG